MVTIKDRLLGIGLVFTAMVLGALLFISAVRWPAVTGVSILVGVIVIAGLGVADEIAEFRERNQK